VNTQVHPVGRFGPTLPGSIVRFKTRSLTISSYTLTYSGKQKKTDVAEHPGVFDHVGLLVNEPPRPGWGCSLSSHPTTLLAKPRPIVSQLFHY